MSVYVTNRNNLWTITDKFAGQTYKFPPGERVLIPEEAAEHIFGFGLDEKGRKAKMMRMGIANLKDGEKLWNNVLLKKAGNVQFVGVKDGADGIHQPSP